MLTKDLQLLIPCRGIRELAVGQVSWWFQPQLKCSVTIPFPRSRFQKYILGDLFADIPAVYAGWAAPKWDWWLIQSLSPRGCEGSSCSTGENGVTGDWWPIRLELEPHSNGRWLAFNLQCEEVCPRGERKTHDEVEATGARHWLEYNYSGSFHSESST